jgi:acyl carrier protein
MSPQPAIDAQVQAIIADVLAREPDEVTDDARFFADLGGESIEVLELQFQFEKKLGLRLSFADVLAGEQVRTDERGVVTTESLKRLRESFPFLALERLPAEPTPEHLRQALFTVGAIKALARHALQQPAPPPPGPPA